MKKVIFITAVVFSLFFDLHQSFAATFNIQQLIDYSEQHHPEILKTKNQIEGMEYYLAELKAIYDAKFNLELGRGIMNQEPTYALEPTNADIFKSKLSVKKGFDFGLKVEGYASYEESNYRFNDFYSSLNGKIPTTNLTSVDGLLPPGAGIIKFGVQGTMPVFENWMGLLEKLEIEKHYNEISQAKLLLNQQLEEHKFKIYQQYYVYELVTSLEKTKLETQLRNKSYYDLVNQKRAEGVIPEAERLQVYVSNLATEEELISSKQVKEETLLDLKNLIGYPPSENETLEISFDPDNTAITKNNLDSYEIFKQKAIEHSFMEKAASLNIQNAMKKVEMVTNMLNPKTDLYFGVSSIMQKTDPSLLISQSNAFAYPNYFIGLQTELFGGSQTETAKLNQAQKIFVSMGKT
jgi:hypothetical protein